MPESKQYKCPDCETSFSVSISSAGEKVSCPGCQKEITLPSLRELRQLPDYAQPEKPKALMRDVSARERRVGWMVALGVIAAVFIGLAIWWGVPYYHFYNAVNAKEVSDWDVYTTWNQWQFLRPGVDTPLTEGEQNTFYTLRLYWKWIVIYLSIVGVCLVGIVGLWIAPYRVKK